MNEIVTRLNREMLKFAVQRAIFCPRCRGILDTRKAVLVSATGTGLPEGGKHVIACGKCYDDGKASLDAYAAKTGWTIETIDGRPRRKGVN